MNMYICCIFIYLYLKSFQSFLQIISLLLTKDNNNRQQSIFSLWDPLCCDKIYFKYNLDQTWLPFSNLMLKHIYNVLLICSDYDRFLLEVDGRVEEALYSEYTQLGLSNPPKITHANEPSAAMELLNSNREFELVISMLDIGD